MTEKKEEKEEVSCGLWFSLCTLITTRLRPHIYCGQQGASVGAAFCFQPHTKHSFFLLLVFIPVWQSFFEMFLRLGTEEEEDEGENEEEEKKR